MSILFTYFALSVLALTSLFNQGLQHQENQDYEKAALILTQVQKAADETHPYYYMAAYHLAEIRLSQNAETFAKDATELLNLVVAHAEGNYAELARSLATKHALKLKDQAQPGKKPATNFGKFHRAVSRKEWQKAVELLTPENQALYPLYESKFQSEWEHLVKGPLTDWSELRSQILKGKTANPVAIVVLEGQQENYFRAFFVAVDGEWLMDQVEPVVIGSDPDTNLIRLRSIFLSMRVWLDQNQDYPERLEEALSFNGRNRDWMTYQSIDTQGESAFLYYDAIRHKGREVLNSEEGRMLVVIAAPFPEQGQRLILRANGRIESIAEEEFLALAEQQGWFLPDVLRRDSQDEELQQLMHRLVDSLGHERYPERERARQELVNLGDVAIPFLEAAKDHADPEIRLTVRAILKDHEEAAARRSGGQLPRR